MEDVGRVSSSMWAGQVGRRDFIERFSSEILQAFVGLEGAVNSCMNPFKLDNQLSEGGSHLPWLLQDSLSLAQWLMYNLCSVNTCRMNVMHQ